MTNLYEELFNPPERHIYTNRGAFNYLKFPDLSDVPPKMRFPSEIKKDAKKKRPFDGTVTLEVREGSEEDEI